MRHQCECPEWEERPCDNLNKEPECEEHFMARYFKITEISEEEYVSATGENLDGWAQLVVPVGDSVYIAVDGETESEIDVDISDFDELRSPEASS